MPSGVRSWHGLCEQHPLLRFSSELRFAKLRAAATSQLPLHITAFTQSEHCSVCSACTWLTSTWSAMACMARRAKLVCGTARASAKQLRAQQRTYMSSRTSQRVLQPAHACSSTVSSKACSPSASAFLVFPLLLAVLAFLVLALLAICIALATCL